MSTNPYPCNERIAEAIRVALLGIAEAGGNRITVAGVQRPTTGDEPWPTATNWIRLEIGASLEVDRDNSGNQVLVTFDQDFWLTLIVYRAEDATDPLDRMLAIFAGEVRNKLMATPYWPEGTPITNLAQDTQCPSITPVLTEDGAGLACQMRVVVTHRVNQADVFTAV
jgi:hypothetical protein